VSTFAPPGLAATNRWCVCVCRTWPRSEQIIDVFHKAVYAYTTGYVVDRWLH